MSKPNYTKTITVPHAPEKVFVAINDPRGWWSQEIDGDTTKLGAEFRYHYQDVHRCVFKISEFEPNKKVVWHVLDNHFNFVKDKSEWIGTDVVFEIAGKGDETEVRFTHVGLVPDYECYEVCSDAWGSYLTGSLRNLITQGKGQPNPLERVAGEALGRSSQDYTTSFLVHRTPMEVFAAINNVRGWWSGKVQGSTDKLGDEFIYSFGDVHRSIQKVTALVPGRKVAWHVSDANLNFVKDKGEWKGTEIVFDINGIGDRTEVRFTHKGLVPAFECYDDCSNAWGMLVNGNLRNLITTGEPQPTPW